MKAQPPVRLLLLLPTCKKTAPLSVLSGLEEECWNRKWGFIDEGKRERTRLVNTHLLSLFLRSKVNKHHQSQYTPVAKGGTIYFHYLAKQERAVFGGPLFMIYCRVLMTLLFSLDDNGIKEEEIGGIIS